MEKRELLSSGKTKSLYTTDNPDLLLVDFRDDATAFDGARHALLDDKGEVNQAISTFIMEYLSQHGVATHYAGPVSSTQCLVKRLKMLPIECVIRNIAAGSLCRRLGVEQAMPLEQPLFEFFLKNDELHDPLITADHAVSFGWATQEQLDAMRAATFRINSLLKDLFIKGNMILVDAKFEFGLLGNEIILGDEISPDSCRIWDVDTRAPLDKDLFRQEQDGVIDAYKIVMQRLGIPFAQPSSP